MYILFGHVLPWCLHVLYVADGLVLNVGELLSKVSVGFYLLVAILLLCVLRTFHSYEILFINGNEHY